MITLYAIFDVKYDDILSVFTMPSDAAAARAFEQAVKGFEGGKLSLIKLGTCKNSTFDLVTDYALIDEYIPEVKEDV